jgi:hypothetical protein
MMTIDDLVGLVGTYSMVISLPPEARREVRTVARAWLESQPELAAPGGREIDVPFRARCWRTTGIV